jgi:hypothetical protein
MMRRRPRIDSVTDDDQNERAEPKPEDSELFTARPPPGSDGSDVYSASTVAAQAPADLLDLVRSAEEATILATNKTPPSANKFHSAKPSEAVGGQPGSTYEYNADDDDDEPVRVKIKPATPPPPPRPSPERVKAAEVADVEDVREEAHEEEPPPSASPPRLFSPPSFPAAPVADGREKTGPPDGRTEDTVPPASAKRRTSSSRQEIEPPLSRGAAATARPPGVYPPTRAELGRPSSDAPKKPREGLPPIVGILTFVVIAIAALALLTR